MSDAPAAELVLAPSRERQRLLRLACAACSALVPVLLLQAGTATPGVVAAAAVCVLAAVHAGRASRVSEQARRIRPCGRTGESPDCADPDDSGRRRSRPREVARPMVAEHVSSSRIVLRGPEGRIVVWRDAVDPDCFRRLAVQARWGVLGGRGSRH